MSSNRLQLNADKTEVMCCTSTRRLSELPSRPLFVAGANVYPVSVVRDLGVFSYVTLARPHVYVELCRAVLAPSASYVTCAVTSQTTAFVRW